MGSDRQTVLISEARSLAAELREVIIAARNAAARSVNSLQVAVNFEIGHRIVEHEQKGTMRADYGKALLKKLAAELTGGVGKGFSETNLKLMRQFYLAYRGRIRQTASDQLLPTRKSQTPSGQLQKSQTPSGKSDTSGLFLQILQTVSAKFVSPFKLSWSHYVFLLGVKDADERSFYEIEADEQGWSLRELKRQFASGLYERPALSRDKDGIRQLAGEGQIVTRPEDLLKDPYVLEFLGLEEKERYSESDLETAIIDKLENFLLELGKGFLFEARQRRFTFEEEHFFVDLVFYNRLLRCYVLLDLKIGKLTHQDLGQMQMYVNYFDRHSQLEDENPTVGIVLCKRKNDALVEITLPKDANIHAREYRLYLPDKEELRKKLMEWTAEQQGEG
jgi:predicted nuclease of restriction endonuclease-like (RecB) superfamily